MGSALRSDQTKILSTERAVCACVHVCMCVCPHALMYACDCALGSMCEAKDKLGVFEGIQCEFMCVCIFLGMWNFLTVCVCWCINVYYMCVCMWTRACP